MLPRTSVKPRKVSSRWIMLIEFPAATALFISASLNLAYRPMWLLTGASFVLLIACHFYFKWRYDLKIPLIILIMAFAAVQVDTIGNHFRWYQKIQWPVPYDVFAHCIIPALLAPALVWLIHAWFGKMEYNVPLSVSTFVAITTNFSLSAFYEITEWWDELYFGGKRIWSAYDTPRDLQWDLIGTLVGAILTFLLLKFAQLRQKQKLLSPEN